MEYRIGCGQCCIHLDISSPIPNHPNGKAAGERCKNLNEENRCTLHGKPEYPKVCKNFKPEPSFCGNSNEEAEKILINLNK